MTKGGKLHMVKGREKQMPRMKENWNLSGTGDSQVWVLRTRETWVNSESQLSDRKTDYPQDRN